MLIVILILICFLILLCIFLFRPKPVVVRAPPTQTLVAQEKINDNIENPLDGLNGLLYAYSVGEESAVLELANIYMHGLHPFYAPNKLEAARICQFIVYSDNFSAYSKQRARDLFKEVRYEADYDARGEQLPADPVGRLSKIVVVPKSDVVIAVPDEPEKDRIVEREPEFVFERINYNDFLFDDDEILINQLENQRIARRREPVVQTFAAAIANDAAAIANDTQNVHSSSVQNMAHERIRQIEKPYSQGAEMSLSQFLANIQSNPEISKEEKANARRVLNSLSDSKHSRYDKSEKEVFDIVWNRINDPVNKGHRDEMIKIFTQNIASGVEYDTVVCSTGKIVRMLGSLDVIDAGGAGTPLQPEWAIDNEMGTVAARIREHVLSESSAVEQEDYNAGRENLLENRMKEELRAKLVADYVNTNILSKEMVDIKIEMLSHGF